MAYLFGSGALLLVATLVLPGADGRESGRLVAIAGCAMLVAIFFVLKYEQIPLWFFKLAPALGTLLVGFVIYFGGGASSAPHAMYLAWVVIASACFFPLKLTAAHGIFAVAIYGLAAELSPTESPTPAMLSLAMFAGTMSVVAVIMNGLTAQLNQLMERLEAAARTDPLTDLLNRRAFQETFDAELARTSRTGDQLGLIVLDLDGFKAYNDRHGHPAGDRALQRLALVLEHCMRAVDRIARVGGEEFAILAPECDTAGAMAVAERVRRAVEVEFGRPDEALTASFGVVSTGGGSMRSELVAAADRALYEAKDTGRNRIVAASYDLDAPPASLAVSCAASATK